MTLGRVYGAVSPPPHIPARHEGTGGGLHGQPERAGPLGGPLLGHWEGHRGVAVARRSGCGHSSETISMVNCRLTFLLWSYPVFGVRGGIEDQQQRLISINTTVQNTVTRASDPIERRTSPLIWDSMKSNTDFVMVV